MQSDNMNFTTIGTKSDEQKSHAIKRKIINHRFLSYNDRVERNFQKCWQLQLSYHSFISETLICSVKKQNDFDLVHINWKLCKILTCSFSLKLVTW